MTDFADHLNRSRGELSRLQSDRADSRKRVAPGLCPAELRAAEHAESGCGAARELICEHRHGSALSRSPMEPDRAEHSGRQVIALSDKGSDHAGKDISGAGGQLDFVLGAYLSKGGKSFICLSSTFFKKKTGQLESRIRPTLENGSIVTDTRANVHYLCTEYGCVNLKGLTSWEKAEALISVAHPDFREELIREAEKLHIWRRSNKI